MKVRILLALLILGIVKISYSQEDFNFYSGAGKVVLTHFPEKTYLKFEEKAGENKLNELGLDKNQVIHFQNDNSFGAINLVDKDVEYAYAIVSSDLTSEAY